MQKLSVANRLEGSVFGTAIKAPLFALLTLLIATGCSSIPYVWAKDIPKERALVAAESETIGRGDMVAISIVGQANLSGNQTVGSDGTVVVPDVGSVTISELTVQEAAKKIESRVSQILKSPQVSVVVVTRFLEVSILGEVETPGKYKVESGDGVANAIAVAGGLTEFANSSGIYLVRSGEPLRIRFKMKELLRGGDSARSFAIRDGDILIVE